jgi:hypothetical protein
MTSEFTQNPVKLLDIQDAFCCSGSKGVDPSHFQTIHYPTKNKKKG